MSTANHLLFFTPILGDYEPFHVPLIQMAGMIIGAPNLMQAFCSCYSTCVCVGVPVCVEVFHSPSQQKAQPREAD